MHAPALAIAWRLFGRHRLGLGLLAGYVATAAVVANAVPLSPRAGMLASLSLLVGLGYVAAVFAYGFGKAPLEGRESGFPPDMLTLPVRTWALVGWPMLLAVQSIAPAKSPARYWASPLINWRS